MNKYFMHRIQVENGTTTKGIEIHDTLDSAVLAYHGRMKNAYGASAGMTFTSCMITDGSGAVVRPYDETWRGEQGENAFFLHYIRKDGETFTKGIDLCETYGAAIAAYHAQAEYGHNIAQHPGVTYVSCMITDRTGAKLKDETWEKEEPEAAE